MILFSRLGFNFKHGKIYYVVQIVYLTFYFYAHMIPSAYMTFYINSITYCTAYFKYVSTEVNLLQTKMEGGIKIDIEENLRRIAIIHQKALK